MLTMTVVAEQIEDVFGVVWAIVSRGGADGGRLHTTQHVLTLVNCVMGDLALVT